MQENPEEKLNGLTSGVVISSCVVCELPTPYYKLKGRTRTSEEFICPRDLTFITVDITDLKGLLLHLVKPSELTVRTDNTTSLNGDTSAQAFAE